ncbi:MAG: ACT domain-containing protein [Anaerolineales bacterium]|jgi:hypothetical protein
MPDRVTLELLSWRLAVCKLPLDATLDLPGRLAEFWTYMATPEEHTLVCLEDIVEQSLPAGTQAETGWRALRVAGSLDFSLVGILASIANPLAVAGVSIFALSTYDTDYVLIKEIDLDRAIEALGAAGFPIVRHS